jgi:hypothetical protein
MTKTEMIKIAALTKDVVLKAKNAGLGQILKMELEKPGYIGSLIEKMKKPESLDLNFAKDKFRKLVDKKLIKYPTFLKGRDKDAVVEEISKKYIEKQLNLANKLYNKEKESLLKLQNKVRGLSATPEGIPGDDKPSRMAAFIAPAVTVGGILGTVGAATLINNAFEKRRFRNALKNTYDKVPELKKYDKAEVEGLFSSLYSANPDVAKLPRVSGPYIMSLLDYGSKGIPIELADKMMGTKAKLSGGKFKMTDGVLEEVNKNLIRSVFTAGG